MRRRRMAFSDLEEIADYKETAVTADGRYAAFLSAMWNLEEDEFEHTLHMCSFVEKEAVNLIWQASPAAGARNLQFSPSGNELAILQTMEEGDRVVIYSVADGTTRLVPQMFQNASSLLWDEGGKGFYLVCDAGAAAAAESPQYSDYWHITRIPERWEWWRKKRIIVHVPARFTENDLPDLVRLAGPGYEYNHSFLSPYGDTLYFLDQVNMIGTLPQLRLRRIHLESKLEGEPIPLPHSFMSTPVSSPSGRYLAYIASRSLETESSSLFMRSFQHEAMNPAGFQLNAYDTRLYVLDLEDGVLGEYGSQEKISAGTPVGMSAAKQEVFWMNEESLAYMATRGHQTIVARVHKDELFKLDIEILGHGASRCHSMTSDGKVICVHSENGMPFVPAVFSIHRPVVTLHSDLLAGSGSLEILWAPPLVMDEIPAPGAWLYEPDGMAEAMQGTVPLIVYLYGGAAQLCMAYEDTHQLLASKGYAVLVINTTGTAGYGRELSDLHVDDWGTCAIPEVLETVACILRRYTALNPNRVAVYGGSYGGFLAMRCLTDSKLFQTACSMAGISNLSSYWGAGVYGYQYGLSSLRDKTRPWSDPERFVRSSPLFLADKVNSPLLLMHGELDGIVPVAESEQMFTALTSMGKEVSLLLFRGEDHGIRGRPKVKLQVRRMLLAWFDKHLRGDEQDWKGYTSGDVDEAILVE
ncbi:hypothetical protein BC351_23450 [Paenibacillus ferrarius]|uniref:Peptidase S9 prolyl oligopeptidase catalytic domain-containing protein n=1 Tax=Paenibacillus ferrarius TaxID=1469647 RepID=A0A1V4HLF0_9BACL|nr:prolyl oligopeptidase family serine peptidase [Paenibacillus ferrarius]OPH58324.1 hypothetical protein BC351_23450 [Paenibacillus ferrarius]